MNKRKLILGLGIAAILICGIGGFVLHGDSGTSELPESLAKLNPTLSQPTVFTFDRFGTRGRTYTFEQSLEEIHALLRQELVKKLGWKDSTQYPPYSFQNPSDPNDLYFLNEQPKTSTESKQVQIIHWRKATTLERYKKKFMVAIGVDKNDPVTSAYFF